MKSDLQDFCTTAAALVIAASYWLPTIWRPLMPPCSLHQPIMALTASPISWLRPGAEAKPRSSPYPMVMSSSVTPWSVAPAASPSPHGDSRSPKVVVADAGVVDASPLLLWPSSSLLRLEPHALALSASASATTPSRAPRALLRFLIWIDLLLDDRPRRRGPKCAGRLCSRSAGARDLRGEHGCDRSHLLRP